MRVALIHNEDAGGGLAGAKIREAIEKAGHELVRSIENGRSLENATDDGVDVVAVAGGDGTVRDAVGAVVGRGVPLAILPLGTANNIARSLGVEGKPRHLARGWETARRVPLALGSARGPWGQRRFIEGVGAGLVPESIAAAKEHGKKRLARGGGGAIRSARRLYRRRLAGLAPAPLGVSADGEALDGEYLLVEVLNIRSVGPNLRLAPDSDPSCEAFELVTAGEREREALLALLDEKAAPEAAADLPRRRVRSVELAGWTAIHIDDELNSSPAGSSAPAVASIVLEPERVEFLVPGGRGS